MKRPLAAPLVCGVGNCKCGSSMFSFFTPLLARGVFFTIIIFSADIQQIVIDIVFLIVHYDVWSTAVQQQYS